MRPGEDRVSLDVQPGENRVSSEGLVTMKKGGWILSGMGVGHGEGRDNVGSHTHMLAALLNRDHA